MNKSQFKNLLVDLWDDLEDPSVLWQGGIAAACLLAAWWIAGYLRWRAPEESPEALKRGAAAFRRVLFPLVAMVLLVAARAVTSRWIHVNALSVAIALAVALAAIRFAVYLLRLGFTQAAWIAGFERAIAGIVWTLVALHLTGLLPEIEAVLDDVKFTMGRQTHSLLSLLQSGFWIAVTLLLALWAGSAFESRLMRVESLHSSLQAVLSRAGKALLLVLALLVILPVVGIDLTVLSVFGGALGVGLGFGLQKIASNYVSGFIILLDRSIRLGDMITADNQIGEVKQITTRYTVVRSLSGVEAIIPNDTLISSTVLNHSYTDRKVRFTVKVQVSYATDVEKLLPELVAIARRHPRVLSDPEPGALLAAFADSGIDLELGFWIQDPELGTNNVRSELSLAILSELRTRGIEIPYPRREVTLRQAGTS
ncbi:MAG: mechanosensitive ion channel [Betaproteobacteria bacterium]|nr:mechanosensitive ion channel [Betaproteobacteria bacterium]